MAKKFRNPKPDRFSPESFGCSPQPLATLDRKMFGHLRISPHQAALTCPQLGRDPSSLPGVQFGCLRRTAENKLPNTTQYWGPVVECCVLEKNEVCDFLEMFSPGIFDGLVVDDPDPKAA